MGAGAAASPPGDALRCCSVSVYNGLKLTCVVRSVCSSSETARTGSETCQLSRHNGACAVLWLSVGGMCMPAVLLLLLLTPASRHWSHSARKAAVCGDFVT